KQSIYATETDGDLRVNAVKSLTGDVTLTTRDGSILDANSKTTTDRDGRTVDVPNIEAINIDLDANSGLHANVATIGKASDDLDIDTGVAGGVRSSGRLYAEADSSIYITESNYELNVLGAKSTHGEVRLTVPDTSLTPTLPPGNPAATTSPGEDLFLLESGTKTIDESAPATKVASAVISAALSVSLWVGDNVVTRDNSSITAGRNITIRGDTRRKRAGSVDVPDTDPDAGVGTTMDLRGTITPGTGASDHTDIFGNGDDDLFLFNQTFLGGQTYAYGSNTPTPAGMTAPLGDGQDTFIVNQLKSMESARSLVTPDHGYTVRRATLDRDGQAGTDTYVINTTGSQSATPSDYVINVLDTGAKDDGVDTLTINGSDAADLYLLRKASYLVGRPNAESPAFVDLLHGT